MEIVMLTGAYNNAGDHLHRFASMQVVQRWANKNGIEETHIVEIDRKNCRKPEVEVTLNQADLILIPGGPTLQPNLVPNIVDLPEKFFWKTAIFGGGIKHTGNSNWSKKSIDFFKQSLPCSVRDPQSLDALPLDAKKRAWLTGCPVSSAEFNTISSQSSAINIAVSDGQRYAHNRTSEFISDYVSTHLETAQLVEHSVLSGDSAKESIQIGADLDKMIATYANAKWHVGFRLHAHLLWLSLNLPSLLLIEDARGLSVSEFVGGNSINLVPHIKLGKYLQHISPQLHRTYCKIIGKKVLNTIRDSEEFSATYDKREFQERWVAYLQLLHAEVKNRASNN